jgi:microcin C transport system permease protein
MDRLSYFIRRLLLMIPTFLGITVVCFTLCQFVPGGPVEQALLRMRGGGRGGEAGGGLQQGAVSPELKKQIEKNFGFDKPILVRYGKWLVHDRMGLRAESYKYPNKTVWEMIRSRMRVSVIFGVTGFLLTYLVCIPLGIAKALRHGTSFDFASSALVFTGYAIPGFAFGMLLKMLLCGTTPWAYDLFPVAGFTSMDFDMLGPLEKLKDVAWHMVLPLLCYVIGDFAVLTLLMKNSLLDQVGQDYIRTVLAKGATMRRAIWGHAFRNALIPIATGFGGVLSVLFAGSVLIERVFEIPGMGNLAFEAIVGRDYMLFMGDLALIAIIGMLGRLLSDFCYLLIDPRISFQ